MAERRIRNAQLAQRQEGSRKPWVLCVGISGQSANGEFRVLIWLSQCNNRRRQPLSYSFVFQIETEWEVTMHDLPQPLLAHLQREARDARVRAKASRAEKEQQSGESRQKRTLLQYLNRKLGGEMHL
jgi:hypothetical protein